MDPSSVQQPAGSTVTIPADRASLHAGRLEAAARIISDPNAAS
jgi:hypothetical protein